MKLVEPPLFNYSNETIWRQNIDTAMEWFTVNNLDFITLYFGEPDSTGHKYGPESTQRRNMVGQVDKTIGYLRQRIRESGLESNLNLIITSDHGMETVIKSNEIHLRNVENFTFSDIQFELLDYGPNGLLIPKEGKLEHVYSVLKNAHPKLHVYKKEEFPKRFHYANHPRITPLLMYGDPGYVIHGVRRTCTHFTVFLGSVSFLLSSSQPTRTYLALCLRFDPPPHPNRWLYPETAERGDLEGGSREGELPPGGCGAGHSHLSAFQRYKVQFNAGEHGFDNEAMNMKTIFRAVGPAFKQGLLVEPFESVNVYALLCELLGIAPEPHDGSLEVTRPMLRECPAPLRAPTARPPRARHCRTDSAT